MRKFPFLIMALLVLASSCKKQLVDPSENEIKDHTDVAQFSESISSGISFVFFHANWCSSCEEQRPAFESTSMNTSVNFVSFIEVDHPVAEEIFEAHNVNGFPHMLVFQDGVEKERLAGKGHTEEQFVNLLLKYQ